MCFTQKSSSDGKVLCNTRLKSKRNSSRLDIHREAKHCDLSLENAANGQPFVSRSAATQTRRDRFFERLQLHQTSTSCTSSENIVIPSNGASYPFKKSVNWSKGSPELPVPKQSPTFGAAPRNPLKKHKTLFMQKKKPNHQPFALVAAVSKKVFSLMLSYLAEVCLRVQQTLRLSLSHVLLALSQNSSPDIKEKKSSSLQI